MFVSIGRSGILNATAMDGTCTSGPSRPHAMMEMMMITALKQAPRARPVPLINQLTPLHVSRRRRASRFDGFRPHELPRGFKPD